MYGLKPIGTSRTTTYNSLDNLRILVRALHCRCRTDHLVKSHNHAGDWKEETHSHPPELTSQNDPAALPDRAPNQTSWAWAAGAASAGPWCRRRRRALFLGVPTGLPARHSGTGKEGGSQPGGSPGSRQRRWEFAGEFIAAVGKVGVDGWPASTKPSGSTQTQTQGLATAASSNSYTQLTVSCQCQCQCRTSNLLKFLWH